MTKMLPYFKNNRFINAASNGLSKEISKSILKDYYENIKSRTDKHNLEIDTYALRLHIMSEEQMANKEAIIRNILMESSLKESEVNKLMLDISKCLRI